MKKNRIMRLMMIVLMVTFFLFSCDYLSFTTTTGTETTSIITDTTNSDTSDNNSPIYSLSSDELSAYIDNLDTTDPVIAASIVMPAVVELNVDIQFSYTATYRSPWGTTTEMMTSEATSQATGFFINDEGYIVTNAHVVTLSDYEDYPDFLYVNRTVTYSFADQDETYTATIVSYDSDLDLAILLSDSVNANQTYLTFFGIDSSSDINLYYGESVIAVGNANGYGISITSGVISAPIRYFEDGYLVIEAIQTDAAINSGNSGGPLTNLYGAVVGINSFKIVTSTSENLGYAIPANVVIHFLEENGVTYSVTTGRAY